VTNSPNRLLLSLPANVFSAIQPYLKLADMKLGDVLAESGGQISQAYFPQSGVISLVVELRR
jgi:hypothetical protein